MFTSVLAKVSDLFDRRVLTTVFFPSLAFWIALPAIWFLADGQLLTTIDTWNEQDVIVQTLQAIGFLTLIAFFSLLIASQVYALTRFYEGYSRLVPRFVKNMGIHSHKRHLRNLARGTEEDYWEIYRRYPPPTKPCEVMPTSLGNVLKSAELYPKLRYGMDALVIWPRLYNLLDDSVTARLRELRSSMEVMIVVSFLGALFGALSGGILLWHASQVWLFLSCFWGGLLVSFLAYHGAVASAVLYADQVRVTFDLHRKKVLEEIVTTVPKKISEERVLWDSVAKFFYRSGEPVWENVEAKKDDKPHRHEASRKDFLLSSWFALGILVVLWGLSWIMPSEKQKDAGQQQVEGERTPLGISRVPRLLGLSTWMVLGVIILGILGALGLSSSAEQRIAWVANGDLTAFHQISEENLDKVERTEDLIPSGAITEKNELLNRYTLSTISEGEFLTENTLGPAVRPELLQDSLAVGIEVSEATALGENLKAGDLVQLVPIPSSRSREITERFQLDDILILNTEPIKNSDFRKGGGFTIIFALPQSKSAAFAQGSVGKGWQIHHALGDEGRAVLRN